MSEREESLRKAQETMRRLQHEVRTPISQIMGYAELLQEELEDRGAEDLSADLNKIRSAAQRLLDLVDGRLRTEQSPGAPPLPSQDESSDTGGATGELAEPDAQRQRILVADGDADARELLARRLERHGFRVQTARDGIEALRMIEAGAPDLVLLEVLMPGMSGLEVLERVRRGRSRSELPIILATALDATQDTVEGLERGANDYVHKPFDLPVVIARVRNQLEVHRAARQVAALARQLEFRSAFIRQALGRDVSDELLVEMAERPAALDLGAENRPVLAVVADVRGTRAREATLSSAQHAAVLGNVLGGLADIVAHYDGLVDAVEGDALVALFGLPAPREDDAERAVACAVAMQLGMAEVNAKSVRTRLPEVEIGVGVASGDVVVVGFGRGDHIRYKAVGEPLGRAVEVESTARGGEVWICGRTRDALASNVNVDRERKLDVPRGGQAVGVYRVLGVAGNQLISLRSVPAD